MGRTRLAAGSVLWVELPGIYPVSVDELGFGGVVREDLPAVHLHGNLALDYYRRFDRLNLVGYHCEGHTRNYHAEYLVCFLR